MRVAGEAWLSFDNEDKYTPTGKLVVENQLNWGKEDSSGAYQQINVKAWQAKGEALMKFKKGDRVWVKGRLVREAWEKDGVKRSKHVLVLTDIQSAQPERAKDEPEAFVAPPAEEVPF